VKWFKARKKPIIVHVREVEPKQDIFLPKEQRWAKGEIIETKEGQLIAISGRNYIIEGVQGEVYPIDKEIFHQTYEILEEGEGEGASEEGESR